MSKSRRRTVKRDAIRLVALSLPLLAAGCDLAGRPRPEDRPIPANQVKDFSVLYQRNCAGCHGADGAIGPAPPLNDQTFLALIPNDSLLQVISAGRPGTPMPAFAHKNGGMLTAEQVRILAEGIKPRWGTTSPTSQELPPYVAPKGKPGDREAGVKLFAVASAGCHGDQGQGGKFDDKPIGAINDPAFLALISDQALRRLILTGRSDLRVKMPNYAGRAGRPDSFKALTSQDVTDLVALLAYWRQGTAVHAKDWSIRGAQ